MPDTYFIDFETFSPLDLTTVAQPLAEMGRVAADLLMARIAAPDRPAAHRLVETRLVPRASSGPAPA